MSRTAPPAKGRGEADRAIAGYAAAASGLVSRFEAVSSASLLSPVVDLFPDRPLRVADIGGGTGRDAALLARKGHHVTVVEPVAAFREAGKSRHAGLGIRWVDDRLPALSGLGRKEKFDLILVLGVWQHLDGPARAGAMRRLAGITAPGGLLVLSLRHGPGASSRPVHTIEDRSVMDMAADAGFATVRRTSHAAHQAANRAAGVHWTWLALTAPQPAGRPGRQSAFRR